MVSYGITSANGWFYKGKSSLLIYNQDRIEDMELEEGANHGSVDSASCFGAAKSGNVSGE
jgi:hypothetical protein